MFFKPGFTDKKAKKYVVVAAGRAYTDVIATPPTEFLQKHQIPIDGQRECSVSELVALQKTLSQTQMASGGPSANTVAVISALGGKAGFFGKVYHDAAGQSFLDDFKRSAVDLICPPYAQTPEISATCLVLLTNNSRSFAYNSGCADYFSAADFTQFDFTTSDFFLIEAHLLTSPIAKPSLIEAMNCAKNKSTIVINLHGIIDWNGLTDTIACIISQADIIIGNQVEQAAFAQAVHLLQLSSRLSQLVLTTKGADGAEVSQLGHVLSQVNRFIQVSTGVSMVAQSYYRGRLSFFDHPNIDRYIAEMRSSSVKEANNEVSTLTPNN